MRSTVRRSLLLGLMEALLDLRAAQSRTRSIPGYTHLRRAQAVLWPHYLLAYFEMFARDLERFEQARARVNVMPLGIGRAGRQRISLRSRSHRARSGLRRHHAQQHGCFGRPRFRARFSVCGVDRPCCT